VSSLTTLKWNMMRDPGAVDVASCPSYHWLPTYPSSCSSPSSHSASVHPPSAYTTHSAVTLPSRWFLFYALARFSLDVDRSQYVFWPHPTNISASLVALARSSFIPNPNQFDPITNQTPVTYTYLQPFPTHITHSPRLNNPSTTQNSNTSLFGPS